MEKTDAIMLLAIDDKPDNLTTLSAVVRDALPQTRVLTATNGPAGIELAAAEDPDVILLDIVMPGMDGFEVCRRLKADERIRDIPVVFLTALKTYAASRVKALEAGAEGFLAKPLETAELTAQIRAMTKVKAANRSKRTEKEHLEALVAERTWKLELELTERKQAEKGRRQSDERFRIAQEMSPDGFTILRPVRDTQNRVIDFTWVYENDAIARLNGTDPQKVVGQRLLELFPGHRDTQFMKTYQQVAESGKSIVFEEEYSGESMQKQVCFRIVVVPMVEDIAVLANDITERKRTEAELQRTLERLKKAINTTIQVMVSAVEVRDPYTAGHQLRSAHLARTIATEMELPPNIIDGIRMAGSIHDIGKLSVPAEILAKPTKLTAIEFSLIKEHPRNGHEMLKDVESPWPLAEIVYQHHERMDGSGYPRNLKGDEILMEARIMAVADVVESMASHRPYRPALGINAALKEIEKNRGIFYDDAVADACLRLFREKGFKLEGA